MFSYRTVIRTVANIKNGQCWVREAAGCPLFTDGGQLGTRSSVSGEIWVCCMFQTQDSMRYFEVQNHEEHHTVRYGRLENDFVDNSNVSSVTNSLIKGSKFTHIQPSLLCLS
ncbi:hypothetical protein RvY_06369 [Ramazzottius varieornatus]|uniref:Uncharacterized protein n=1 Tax=Ramazzottius varieornatus TaxID=947166 RepID=A0A1D1V1T9_RAMVA|nr:hypothetical protein RvY_06369 [Ramazzottius varieornatus]